MSKHDVEMRKEQSPSLWLFLLLMTLYLLTSGGELFISDGLVMYRTTQALVERHSLAVEPDPDLPQVVVGWDGRFYSMYDLGQPVLAIPFYLLGRALAAVLPDSDPQAAPRFWVSVLPQVSTALAGVVLYHMSLALFHRRKLAIVLALVWATGTLAWPYAKFFFSEALITLFLLLSCWMLMQHKAHPAPWKVFLAGLVFGVAVSIRINVIIYAVAFLVYFWLEWISRPRRAGQPVARLIRDCGIFFSGVVPFVGLFLGHNYARFHDIWHTGYAGETFSTPLYVGLYGLLFSPGRSLFLYSPLTLLGLVALRRFHKEFPALAGLIMTAFVTALLFFSAWWAWYGGWSWGPRFLVPLIPLLLLPIGVHMNSRRFFPVLAIMWMLSLLVVIPGISVDFNAYIVDALKSPYGSEYQLWFFPWDSPLIGHWRYLLHGDAIALMGYYRISDFMGLPVGNLFYFALMGGLFLLALMRIRSILFSPTE